MGPKSPDWVARLNNLGVAAGGHSHLVRVDADELLELAQASTGLDDFGNDDWLNNFRKNLAGLEKSGLNTLGRLMRRSSVLRTLRNRLLITREVKANPQRFAKKVGNALFIVGNPRTGTSILFELLMLDPQIRAPLTWEVNCPLEYPEQQQPAVTRPEISQAFNDLIMDIQPDMLAMHEFRWDLPAEAFQFFEYSFVDLNEYGKIKMACPRACDELLGGLKWHDKILQILSTDAQSCARKSQYWLLKGPLYLYAMEEIVAYYPDARIIYTHRDPAKSMASFLLLQDSIALSNSGRKAESSASSLEPWRAAADRIMEMRDGNGMKNKVSDFFFSDFMKDPVDAIRKLYLDMGLIFPEGFERKILSYLRARARYRHGKYNYAEERRITPEDVRKQFGSYIRRYNIAAEK